MATSINADNGAVSGSAGLKSSADSSGVLQLQTAGVTAISIDASQAVSFTNSPTVTGGTANGVAYLNGSKVLTTGSALTFDGTNLGVGTSTYNGRLVVKNPSVSGNQVIYAIQAATSTSQLASWDLNQTTDVSTFGTDYGAPLAFKVNSTEKMRLDASGNLLVGTTNTNPAGSGVTGVVIGPTGAIKQSSGSGASYFAVTGTSGTHIQFYTYNAGAVAAGLISSNGSTTSYTGASDYRLKENIAPMTGALAKVAQLNPVTYKWKLDGSDGQGFIAHELQTIFPDAVVGEKDATREEEYEATPAIKDEQGIVVTEAIMGTRTVPVYQGVDTSFLVATLTAAIQEQQALITQLQADVAALKGA